MKIVAYYRVSTAKQGHSGLGLEAQQADVQAYAIQRNGKIVGKIVGNYVEVESGKRTDRPQLAAALAHARREKATLVVAKLDRLARRVSFIAGLMESGVPFDCADRPGADPFRLHIEAAINEEEARKISQRTKAALAAYRARGGKLGAEMVECRNLTPEARQRGLDAALRVRRAKAAEAHEHLFPTVRQLRIDGASYQAVADHLNAEGHRTRHGSAWTATAAMRVCRLAG